MTADFGKERSQYVPASSGFKEGDSIRRFISEGVGALADYIPERAPTMKELGDVVESVVKAFEGGSRYLSERDIPEIAEDVTQLIRRYPIRSLWVGLSLGFLVGRVAFARRLN